MSKESAKQALELFDTPQKWQSFVELAYQKDVIQKLMFKKVKEKINNHFNNDTVTGWSFTNFNPWDYKWYLSDYGSESVCIWMWGVNIGISNSNNNKISDLLNNEKYSPLKSLFRFDGSDNCFIFFESGNFSFNKDLEYDKNFTEDSMAWYILNESDQYLTQLIAKVDALRKDEKLTKLLKELNEELQP